ncbi:NAD(P)/FAD-dependent oxidoreductase [Oceanobacter mangrovi]|uniref:NAD(P)/FAD-dependent oxidoreductase n=1 Tax=Oceanobacter mangrovi TaxID=2862510 RepID=UPI001C8E474C|nr:FAD-dependent oxidoreductase [Oceanobacter mangrovi]
MTTNTLVVIGNGMASNRVLEQLGIDHPFETIHVLSDEAIPHYNRIMLSPLLARETTLAAITPHNSLWYQQRRIQVHLSTPVASINTENRQVICQTGQVFDYDALLLATGSRSAIPSMPGTDGDTLPVNVLGFRTMTDVDAMLASVDHIQHATVIGAGLLGVEAAVGLQAQGIKVTLMHRNPVLMNRQLDAVASGILQRELEQRGIDVRTGISPLKINAQLCNSSENSRENGQKDNIANAIEFEVRKTGTTETLKTDLVVFATGIIPNAELARAAGIHSNRGICVNSLMQTSAPDVFSLGECCEFEGATYGLVAPIWEQAKTLARELRRYGNSKLEHQPLHYAEQDHLTKLKVSGVDMHSMGRFEAEDGDDVIDLQDLAIGVYKKLVIRDNRIVGVLCVGDVMDSGWYFELLGQQADISEIRSDLVFGKAWCESA